MRILKTEPEKPRIPFRRNDFYVRIMTTDLLKSVGIWLPSLGWQQDFWLIPRLLLNPAA